MTLSRSRLWPEPLAEADAGRVSFPMSGPDIPHRDGFDLPLPRRGVLSGKSPRTSRRWRLFFVQRKTGSFYLQSRRLNPSAFCVRPSF